MKVFKTLIGSYPPVQEVLPTGSETFVKGEALVITSGLATKCGATAIPIYICEEDYVAPASGARPIKVTKVLPHILYTATAAADASEVAVGTKVTLHTDGLQVTATSTSGVATIVSKELGTGAVGTTLVVSF